MKSHDEERLPVWWLRDPMRVLVCLTIKGFNHV